MHFWMREAKRYKPAWATRPPSLVMPTVGFDFLGKRGLLNGAMVPITDLITHTRASTGTYINDAGVLVSAAVNELRYAYDTTTFRPLGMLGEAARTNLCLRSNNHNTSPWIGSGATRAEATGTGPDNVLNSANLVTIPATGGQGYYQTFTVTASTTYTWSQWVKLGTASIGDATMAFRDDTAGVFIASAVTQTGANRTTWTRVTYSLTTPVGCVLLRCYPIRSALGTGGTVWIYGAQLELGANVSTYIPTVASTVARAADLTRLSDAAFAAGLSATEGTWMLNMVGPYATGGVSGGVAATSSPSFNDCMYSACGGGNFASSIVSGGGAQISFANVTGSAHPTPNKHIFAYKVNNTNTATNGVAKVTDTACALPTTTMGRFWFLGAPWAGGSSNSPFGSIASAFFWPTRLVDADLPSAST